jgi:uncharacterized membrane protein
MDITAAEWVPLLARWLHFVAGITWVGMLYFFNLVNLHFQKSLDGDTKKKLNPELLLRALFWFRWGAMFTVAAGLFIIWWKYFYLGPGMKGEGGLMTTPGGQWISFGGLLGILMFLNVWIIIWPAQKRILGGLQGKNEPPPANVAARAVFASKSNVMLSVPMLFGMAGGGHLTVFSWPMAGAVFVVGAGVGHLILRAGGWVKPTV